MTETQSELPNIGAPATRALASIGVTSLAQLAEYTRSDVGALHGVGPKALRILDAALAETGLAFAPKT